MEIINLNLIPGLNNPVCHVSQFDVGRIIQLDLYEGSSIYTLSGNETIKLVVRKPDNTVLIRDITNTSSTYVRFSTTEQMCPLPGKNICELQISNSGTILHSVNLYMFVEEGPLYKGVETQSALDNLNTQIEEAIRGMNIGGGLISNYIEIKTAEYS